MKHLIYKSLILVLLLLSGRGVQAQVVINVDFQAEGNTVVITYDLDAQANIAVCLSLDGSWEFGPALKCVSGDVGRNVAPGRKRVVWDVLSEMPAGVMGDVAFKVKILPGDFSIRINGVAFDMVYVEGGTFTMGATSEQGCDAFDDEKLAHQVTISDFHIGKYEVTQAQWRAVMGTNPSYFKGDDLPVEQVGWADIQEFLRKLNAQGGRRYRLPTEAEWEYAARGGNKSRGYKYCGGNYLDAVGWYEGNSVAKTHPVGQKTPNELDLYDMSGNVMERCQDWYGGYSSSAQTNPTGPSVGVNRVMRSSSWQSSAKGCRISFRHGILPDEKTSRFGFRLVAF